MSRDSTNIFIKTEYDADINGHFNDFGGRYAPEMLIPALEELEAAYSKAKKDKRFQKDLMDLYQNYDGRPTPLYFAKNLTEHLRGAKIFIKNI